MKHKKQEKLEHQQHEKKTDQIQLEIDKAVAQAWHSRFNDAKEATSEFDVRKRNFRTTPTRFKLEFQVMNKLKVDEEANKAIWNFNHSLWDPFEIVAVSKKLETGLVLNYDFDDVHNINEHMRVLKRRRESKNSLRNLFNMISSRRFDDNFRISSRSRK